MRLSKYQTLRYSCYKSKTCKLGILVMRGNNTSAPPNHVANNCKIYTTATSQMQ